VWVCVCVCGGGGGGGGEWGGGRGGGGGVDPMGCKGPRRHSSVKVVLMPVGLTRGSPISSIYIVSVYQRGTEVGFVYNS